MGRPAVLGAVGALLAVAGCSADEPRSLDDVLPPETTSAAPATTVPATPRPTQRPFPQDCADLLGADQVLDALDRPLRGSGSFVYAGPVPSSGRLERITCGYGISPARPGGKPVPRVEITLNRYRSADVAADRVQETVADAQSEGQQVRSLPLGERPGFVLTDPVESSYVIADGPRTLVVTVRRSLLPAPAAPVVLVDLASRVLGLGPTVPEEE